MHSEQIDVAARALPPGFLQRRPKSLGRAASNAGNRRDRQAVVANAQADCDRLVNDVNSLMRQQKRGRDARPFMVSRYDDDWDSGARDAEQRPGSGRHEPVAWCGFVKHITGVNHQIHVVLERSSQHAAIAVDQVVAASSPAEPRSPRQAGADV
jgi:hypothetical protein